MIYFYAMDSEWFIGRDDKIIGGPYASYIAAHDAALEAGWLAPQARPRSMPMDRHLIILDSPNGTKWMAQ